MKIAQMMVLIWLGLSAAFIIMVEIGRRQNKKDPEFREQPSTLAEDVGAAFRFIFRRRKR